MFPSKILPLIFSPLVVVLILLVYGFWSRRRWPVALAAIVLLIGSLPVVGDRLLDTAQGRSVRLSAELMREADAVVVLAGGINVVRSDKGVRAEWNEAVDRILGGVELMLAGRAPRLILSSTAFKGIAAPISEGAEARRLAIALGVPADRIEIAPAAFNTAEEASRIRPLFPAAAGERAEPRIILVTSASHMPRARRIFAEAGFEVDPYPVDFNLPVGKRWDELWLPRAGALLKTDTVVREYLGRGFYWLKHELEI